MRWRKVPEVIIIFIVLGLISGCSTIHKKEAPQPRIVSSPSATHQQDDDLKVILQRAENCFRQGSKAQHMGNFEEALLKFGEAIDIITHSGVNLEGSPQLKGLFDDISSCVAELTIINEPELEPYI
ncbi:MAG: hypothetical protein OEZ30_07160, partial [Candidatus Aminicenantes bacterium]|nr:hypothetical protein [Candidatus Aminicenantes bacterium]